MNNKEIAFEIAEIINNKFPDVNVYFNEFDDLNEIFIIIDDRKIYDSLEYTKLVSKISAKYEQKDIFFSALFPEEKLLDTYINLTKDIISDKYSAIIPIKNENSQSPKTNTQIKNDIAYIYMYIESNINSVTTLVPNNNISDVIDTSRNYSDNYSCLEKSITGENIWLNNKAA